MFAGIDVTRPWPVTGMTSATWLSVPVQTVKMNTLVLCQEGIYLKPLIDPDVPYGGDRYPHVVLWNDKMYLEDGHHRVIRAAIAGLLQIQARVLRIDNGFS